MRMTKKISIAGLALGAVVGVIAGAFLGQWFLWLGLGITLGLIAGTVRARRLDEHEAARRTEVRV